jgi:hypothetical protein
MPTKLKPVARNLKSSSADRFEWDSEAPALPFATAKTEGLLGMFR